MLHNARSRIMKIIKLTQNQVAIVDDEDFERLSAHKWRAQLDPCSGSYYALRSLPRDNNGRRGRIYMHREVMNAKPGEFVDHVHHNTLDQRKENLRICTPRQNSANKRLALSNSSGYKGVMLNKRCGRWYAQLKVNGRGKHLGYYSTPVEAAVAYDAAATAHYGEFALTNKALGLLPK